MFNLKIILRTCFTAYFHPFPGFLSCPDRLNNLVMQSCLTKRLLYAFIIYICQNPLKLYLISLNGNEPSFEQLCSQRDIWLNSISISIASDWLRFQQTFKPVDLSFWFLFRWCRNYTFSSAVNTMVGRSTLHFIVCLDVMAAPEKKLLRVILITPKDKEI